MIQRLGLALCLVAYSSYSHSDPYSYGASGNAASGGLSWGMGNVFPNSTGLDINGLIYRYSTVKNPEDDMKVHIGNLNPNGDGYTFRETDDWSGVPGNTITKSFTFNNIPFELWGRGSIEVEGKGEVKNPYVIYNYRIDECFDPQLNPSCPGYKKPMPVIPEVEVYNALEDNAVVDALDTEDDFKYDEDGNRIEDEEEEEKPSRIELGLASSKNALTLVKVQSQSDIITQMNNQTNIAMYYNAKINGGEYKDKHTLSDKQMPDNKMALRNTLSQQILHEKMIDMQYNK